MVKRVVQGVLGIAISALMLWLALRNVDMNEAGAAMQRVAWWVYPAYFVQLTFTHLLRTLRWRLQVDRLTGKTMPLWDALGICAISFAAIFLLPFRLGEFIRPYLATRRGYGRKSLGLAAVALERVLDGLVMTGVLAVILTQMRGQDIPTVIALGGYLALAVFGGALAVFVATYRWREVSMRFWRAVLTPFGHTLADKLLGMLAAFIEGLKSLPTVRDILVYVGITLLYWLINGLGMWMLTVGMDLNVPVLGAFFVLSCLVVGITIPAGPGNVGNFEYAIQISLAVFGVSHADGAAYGIWTHLFQLMHLLVMCLPFLAMLRMGHLPTESEMNEAEPVASVTPPAP